MAIPRIRRLRPRRRVAPPVDDPSAFEKIIDILSRPSQSVLRPALKAIKTRGSITFPEVAQESKKGFLGIGKPVTGRELLEASLQEKLPGSVGVPLGIATEVILDPIMFMPGVVSKTAFPFVRSVWSRGLRPAIEKTRLGNRAMRAWGRTFLTDFSKNENIKTYQLLGLSKAKATALGTDFADRITARNISLANQTKKLKVATDKLEEVSRNISGQEKARMIEFIESKGRRGGPLSKSTMDVVKRFERLLGPKGALRRLERKLLPAGKLDDLEELGYVTRILSPEARNLLAKTPDFQGIGSRFSTSHLSLMKRVGFQSLVLPSKLPALEQVVAGLVRKNASPSKIARITSIFEKRTKILKDHIDAGISKVEISNPRVKEFQKSLKFLNTAGVATPPIQEMTIAEINALAKAGNLGIPGLKGKKISEFFITDPATIAAIRGERTLKATTASKFLRDVADPNAGFAIDITTVLSTDPRLKVFRAQAPFIAGLIDNPNLRFLPEVAREIEKAAQLLQLPDELNLFLSVWDTMTSWWKGWVTAPRFAFHLRNMAGNLFNTHLSGLSFVEMGNSMAHATNILNGRRGIIKTAVGELSYDRVRILIKKTAVRGRSFFTEDLPQVSRLQTPTQKFFSRTIGLENPLIRFGREVGQVSEDHARVSMFIGHLIKGGKKLDFIEGDKEVLRVIGSLDDLTKYSKDKVKKFLFDYDELTEVERKVWRRIFPFYTWSRKNYPIQIQSIITKPSNILFPVRLKRNIESSLDNPPDERFMPEWLKKGFPVRIGVHADGQWKYVMLRNWLPAVDIQELLTGDFLFQMINPIAARPLEFKTNYSIFLNRELQQFPGQKKKFFGVDVDRRIEVLLRNVAFINEVERNVIGLGEIWGKTDQPGIFGITTTQKMELPVKTRIINTLSSPETFDLLLGYFTGLKPIKFDPAKSRRIFEIRQSLERQRLESLKRSAFRREDVANIKVLEKLIRKIETGK